MERFTEKTPGGAVNIHYPRKCFFPDGTSDKIAKSAFRQNAIEKLCAYEDTGLEPEEVNSVKLALMGKSVAEVKEFEGVPIDRLRELAQADREGRCVVLPCKVGDTVWRIQYVQNKKGNYVVGIAEIKFGLLWASEFGKTVFLTREEAEKALGGGQDEPLPEPPEEE